MLDTTKIRIRNCLDANGKPAGGNAVVTTQVNSGDAMGYLAEVVRVSFQDGPILDAHGRNGAFVEDLLWIALKRIEFYNAAGFACDENTEALRHIDDALAALGRRTARRVAQGVEGTHKGN